MKDDLIAKNVAILMERWDCDQDEVIARALAEAVLMSDPEVYVDRAALLRAIRLLPTDQTKT